MTKTDAEWQRTLTPGQYYVLRKHDTEFAGSSPLLVEHRKGTFSCAGCGQPLFSSDAKYQSGSGWPSFVTPLENAVATSRDSSLGMTRTEVHCRRCGGHLGHVFEDGPQPTGLRYCTNGTALTFTPEEVGHRGCGNASRDPAPGTAPAHGPISAHNPVGNLRHAGGHPILTAR